MTYQEALDFLFTATPVFQHIGGQAYKPGLERMSALDRHYGHAHRAYKTIHIGGTNGKGSTSHTLAAVLQSAGYRVGLFTSPHLVDFRERIRVDGVPVSEDYVCRFTEQASRLIDEHQPSFFELTSMMALCYFAEQSVDVAIIEVGLGGRLDSTNIIEPICSVITNISLDHTQYLGSSLAEIAGEKAGIIKAHTPIIIGSAQGEGVRAVFAERAEVLSAPIVFAEDTPLVHSYERSGSKLIYNTALGQIEGALNGEAQIENTNTILCTLQELAKLMPIPPKAIAEGFAKVIELTGLMGRWQKLSERPLLICDTGHNEAGINIILKQIKEEASQYQQIHIILGMAADKDVRRVLSLFPREYRYYFTQASVNRALPAEELAHLAEELGLDGAVFDRVTDALRYVQGVAGQEDFIFVGGSNFVVADLLRTFYKNQ